MGVTDCAQSFSLAYFSAYISSSVAISLPQTLYNDSPTICVFIINFCIQYRILFSYIMSKDIMFNSLLRQLSTLSLMDYVLKSTNANCVMLVS